MTDGKHVDEFNVSRIEKILRRLLDVSLLECTFVAIQLVLMILAIIHRGEI